MPSWIALWSALIGALIGAAASVTAQIVNQRAIRKREDRDRLRTAYIEFAESAFRLLQRVELVLIYTHNRCNPSRESSISSEDQAERYRLLMDAGAAQDQLSTALCKVTMFRLTQTSLDNGEALYRGLMALPTETGEKEGETLTDLERLADRKRVEIRDWLHEQSRKLA